MNPTGASANSGVKFANDPTKTYLEHHSYVGGVNGAYFGGTELDNGGNVIWPVYRGTLTGNPVTDSANSNSYASGYDGNLSLNPTMSRWCAQCHDKWHEVISTTNGPTFGTPTAEFATGPGPDWRRHPVNGMMPRAAAQGCATTCHTSLLDRSTYNNALITQGKGLPVTASDYYAGYAYYLPECGAAGNPACTLMDATGGGSARANHKVFCLSCHFAHGGPYNDNLRWDYTQVVSTGDQTGNGVPVTKGCQLCHNRGG
ncbi:MAG: hypothetical protein HZB84_07355 [Deltaproteobacteria bacterium]|nr:hypothetical protein [Deltaproteobacteria bacterium]